MTPASEDEESPLPLLHSRALPSRPELPQADRLRPATAGALTGFLGGAAGLGVVHALHLARIAGGISRIAAAWAVPADAAVPVAYVAAGIGGAIVGAGFASVTKHLRRSFAALLVWALVFFVSLTMLVLAMSSAYGHGLGVSMAPAILLASTAYAFVVSFQLPLRRRG